MRYSKAPLVFVTPTCHTGAHVHVHGLGDRESAADHDRPVRRARRLRTARRRARPLQPVKVGAFLALLLIGVFSLSVGRAAAQTTPTTTDCTTSGTCGDAPASGGNNGFLGDDGTGGKIDDSKLDIGYSTGGGFAAEAHHPVRQGIGQLTDLTFQFQRFLVHTAESQIHSALSFKFVTDGTLPTTAERIAHDFQTKVMDRLGAARFLLFVGVFICCWHALRGRVSRGLGELALTLIIVGVTTATWMAPNTMLLGQDGAMAKSREAATTVGGIIATGQPPPDPGNSHSDIYQPLLEAMQHSFIVVPYSLLNWGQVFDDPSHPTPACLQAFNHIMATGPHGTDDKPRDEMLAAGCAHAKDFNYTPSGTRLAESWVSLVGSMFLVLLAIIEAFFINMAQLGILFAVIVAPLVFPCGVIPGWGRRVLAWWVTFVTTLVLAVIIGIAVLVLTMVAVNAVAGTAGNVPGSDGRPLMEVFGTIDILILAAIWWHHRWHKASRRAARRFTSRVANMSPGGAGRSGDYPVAAGVGAAVLMSRLPRRAYSGSGGARPPGAGGRPGGSNRPTGNGPGSGPRRRRTPPPPSGAVPHTPGATPSSRRPAQPQPSPGRKPKGPMPGPAKPFVPAGKP